MSSDNASIDTLTRAEQEIHQQIVFLSNLRAKRNFLLPVFRLPPETLAIIFIHAARDYYESDNGGHFTPCIPTWVNVSYVCSHWRSVALNCPTLWTYHFNTSLRWTEELLLRSKEASLKISCIYEVYRYAEVSGWWPSLLVELLKHSERIQELHLDIPRPFLPAQLPLCAPRLKKLEITFPPHPRSIVITDGDKFALHTLKLNSCSLPWYSLNLTGLKILSLRSVRSPSPPNMVEFLSILSSMQDLTILNLEHVLPGARSFLSSGGLDVSPKINFPHLTLLAVVAPLSTVVALLFCVNIPPRTRLNLGLLTEPRYSIGDYDPISSFLAQHFSTFEQSSGTIFRSLVLCAGYFPTLSFRLGPGPLSPLVGSGYDIPLKITLSSGLHNDTWLTESDKHRIISDICCSMPLTNIQRLHVTEPHRFSSEFWREILGCLDGLRSLKLSDGFMPDLSLLSLAAREPEENSDGQPIRDQDPTLGGILVPALEELELKCITFTQGEGRMCQQSLFRALSTRKGLQERVTMIECEDGVKRGGVDGSP